MYFLELMFLTHADHDFNKTKSTIALVAYVPIKV